MDQHCRDISPSSIKFHAFEEGKEGKGDPKMYPTRIHTPTSRIILHSSGMLGLHRLAPKNSYRPSQPLQVLQELRQLVLQNFHIPRRSCDWVGLCSLESLEFQYRLTSLSFVESEGIVVLCLLCCLWIVLRRWCQRSAAAKEASSTSIFESVCNSYNSSIIYTIYRLCHPPPI